MKNWMLPVCWILLLATPASAEVQRWEFSGVEQVDMDLLSGEVFVQPADGDQLVVELDADVRPDRSFEPIVEQSGRRLSIEEDWKGRNTRGHVEWTISIPQTGKATSLGIDSASGGLDARGVALEVDLDTASGDIRLTEVQLDPRSSFETASGDYRLDSMSIASGCRFETASGDLELENLVLEEGCRFRTASGDIELRGCKGTFDMGTASGNIDLSDCEIEGEAEFSTASGDVDLDLARLPKEGLRASSASGDVQLDVQDFGSDFTLILVKREGRGRISCPFPYTSEDTFRDHDRYERKIVERGSGEPEVELRTASGRVVVRN